MELNYVDLKIYYDEEVDEFWLVQPLDCPLLINVIYPIMNHPL
jgi:hypothetical protein